MFYTMSMGFTLHVFKIMKYVEFIFYLTIIVTFDISINKDDNY